MGWSGGGGGGVCGCVFFFFQAEDGIRDRLVTGVQTCALPILLKRSGGYGKSFLNQKANNPQRQQIHYAYALKNVANGWTPELRKEYFKWFAKSRNFQGGASFGGFIENFRKESLAQISDQKERAEMDEIGRAHV